MPATMAGILTILSRMLACPSTSKSCLFFELIPNQFVAHDQSSRAGLPDLRIAVTVKNCNHVNELVFNRKADDVRKPAHKSLTNVSIYGAVQIRILLNAIKRLFHALQEFTTQTGFLVFIPPECAFHVLFGIRLNPQGKPHRFSRILFFTSSHDKPLFREPERRRRRRSNSAFWASVSSKPASSSATLFQILSANATRCSTGRERISGGSEKEVMRFDRFRNVGDVANAAGIYFSRPAMPRQNQYLAAKPLLEVIYGRGYVTCPDVSTRVV